VNRSGAPDTVPGRCLNLSLRGVAAVVAGNLFPGESVAVEIGPAQGADRSVQNRSLNLATEERLRLHARVRHQKNLRCGLEFVGLSADQRTALRNRIKGRKPEPERNRTMAVDGSKGPESGGPAGPPPAPPSSMPWPHTRGWLFLVLSAVILLAVLWWRWERGWEDLEAGLRRSEAVPQVQAHVPADVMEKLVRHRVDPDYPAAARPGRLQGVIVLDVVVGTDGSVADVRALNGPEILAQSAADAMRWWRFEPYKMDGTPAVAETTVAVEFKP
jgi:TonB family protein